MLLILLLNFFTAESYFAWGPCPKPTLQSNFQISQYLGTWYDLLHAKDFFWELGGDCDIAQYSTSSVPGQITVKNSETLDGKWEAFYGNATCQANDPPHCSVDFFPTAPKGDYEVVTTDYVNYSLVFSCTGNGLGHDMWFWFLSRTQNYPVANFIPTIKALGFPESEFHYTNQTGCPPIPSTSNEVIISY